MVAIVGQVAGEDVEFARNHPPRVSHFHLILRRQENPELSGGEGSRRHCRALPGAQAAQTAVGHLQRKDQVQLPLKDQATVSLQLQS